MVSEKKILKFSHYKRKKERKKEGKDQKSICLWKLLIPRVGPVGTPHDMTGRIRVEKHLTLLHTKCILASCGPHGLREYY